MNKTYRTCLILIVMVLSIASCSGLPKGYVTNVDEFVKEAEKIDIMTEQGINYSDYSSQLIEVKSAFSNIGDETPEKMKLAIVEFDLAIKGWSGAQEIWSYKFKGGECEGIGTPEMLSFLTFVTSYLDTPETKSLLGAYESTCDDWISVLFSGASIRYEAGLTEYKSLTK